GVRPNNGLLRWGGSGIGNNYPCGKMSEDATVAHRPMLVVNYVPPPCTPPTANAGGPYTICQTGGTLTGTATNQTSVSWSDAGGGTFGSPSSLTTTFTPTSAEIAAGTATVMLTASNSPCTAATSNATITIKSSPTQATVGGTQTICSNGTT